MNWRTKMAFRSCTSIITSSRAFKQLRSFISCKSCQLRTLFSCATTTSYNFLFRWWIWSNCSLRTAEFVILLNFNKNWSILFQKTARLTFWTLKRLKCLLLIRSNPFKRLQNWKGKTFKRNLKTLDNCCSKTNKIIWNWKGKTKNS